jgi:hypothetical protein
VEMLRKGWRKTEELGTIRLRTLTRETQSPAVVSAITLDYARVKTGENR